MFSPVNLRAPKHLSQFKFAKSKWYNQIFEPVKFINDSKPKFYLAWSGDYWRKVISKTYLVCKNGSWQTLRDLASNFWVNDDSNLVTEEANLILKELILISLFSLLSRCIKESGKPTFTTSKL